MHASISELHWCVRHCQFERFSFVLTGVGFATLVIVSLHNIYYQVVLGWAFHYLYKSFTSQLPWASCNNAWNTPTCRY